MDSIFISSEQYVAIFNDTFSYTIIQKSFIQINDAISNYNSQKSYAYISNLFYQFLYIFKWLSNSKKSYAYIADISYFI